MKSVITFSILLFACSFFETNAHADVADAQFSLYSVKLNLGGVNNYAAECTPEELSNDQVANHKEYLRSNASGWPITTKCRAYNFNYPPVAGKMSPQKS